ncbi:MaoC family dehydratase [Aquabacter cavernae]|uniref:MaoC family dehydratase n=1 Tax=Aquabacter cavernae TaxID=2496029 RepID=UPI000F8F3748|nr:MaoC family dehydratase [Aquabacter cavernae]
MAEAESAQAKGGLLYLNDLEIGRRFVSGPVTLDADAIKAFAGAYDPQPFHMDEEAAKDSLFGGLAASGWHTMALTMRMIVESVPIAGGVIGGGGDIAWPRPTRPGDTLHAESEVVSVTPSRSRPDRGMVLLKTQTLNQKGEVVQVLQAKLVVPRRG